MPVEKSLELIKDRENKFSHTAVKDIHEKNKEHLMESYEAACKLAKKYKWNEIKCVKSGKIRTIEDINQQIYQEVKKSLNEK